ncbi:MAG: exlusion protein FxsA [Anaerolineae bacterium SG8_19]|nr:MAG: exlusion protein FxsA [Anaerolineae bacterium SG8_19]
MLTKLLLLFVLVPIVELILLVEIGQLVGTLPTIALIIFTGVLGAFLVRRQGVQVLTRIRAELQGGRLPTDSIFDGAIILVAGAFLVTPGILTDTLGFLCLIPTTRRLIKRGIWTRMERAIRNDRIFKATFRGTRYPDRPEDVIIIDHDDYS